MGTLLGWAVYGLSPTYRRNLCENLVAAGYPDSTTKRAAIAAAGRMLAEIPYIWFRPTADIVSKIRRVDGSEHIEAALAAGRGIVFLTPHLGCFEVTTLLALNRFPLTILYRLPKLSWLAPLVAEGRERNSVRLAPNAYSGVRSMVSALARGEAIGMLPDQVPSEGEWAEFFGKPAYTMTLAPKLARRPKTICLLVYGERLAGAQGYVLHVRPMLPLQAGESEVRRLNRSIEELVRACPEQYMWGYNRYKRPLGACAPP